MNPKVRVTSLKIFKHYKLKPSFWIVKDDKIKDKEGVEDKHPLPHPQILADQLILIWFDPIWSSLNQFYLIWSKSSIWFILIQLDPIWSNWNHF